MAHHSSLNTEEIVVAVVGATLGTVIIILVAIVFYLLRTRTSTCTKPTATEEEKVSVLSKHHGPAGSPAFPSSIITAGSTSPHPDLTYQKQHARVASLSGQYSPYVGQPSGSGSSQRSTKRGSIKSRRLSKEGSVSSLTISVTSSAASQTSAVQHAHAKNPSQQSSTSTHKPSTTMPSRDQQVLQQTSKPLTVQDLESIAQSLGQLSYEFMSLPMNYPDRTDFAGCHKEKNRHPSVLPNNNTRIRLKGSRYKSHMDGYINANYVRGSGRDISEPAFIATQGPLPSTVADFWWMIWQENVSVVVMLTKLREKNKLVCEKYWPITNETYGDIVVTCEYNFNHQDSKYQLNGYLIADIGSANQRRVEQFLYSDWPDKEAPEDASGLFAMMEEIAKQRQMQLSTSGTSPGPVLVHCSAGIGRTGCYIALNSAIELYENEGKIDILGTVAKIRIDRGGMVQTLEQYEFIHKALLQYIKEKGSSQCSRQFFVDERDENEQ